MDEEDIAFLSDRLTAGEAREAMIIAACEEEAELQTDEALRAGPSLCLVAGRGGGARACVDDVDDDDNDDEMMMIVMI